MSTIAIAATTAQAPEVVAAPTVPSYAVQDALAIIDARLRQKRPSVTRTSNVRRCRVVVGSARPAASLRLAALDPRPFLAMMLQGPADRGMGERRQQECVDLPVETPYTGDRAHSLSVDPADVAVTVGEPVRVAVPDMVTEFAYDIPNCSSVPQSATYALSYQVRTGDTIVVTNAVTVASGSGSQVSASIAYKGVTIGGQRSSTRTRTVQTTTARTDSYDETITRTATIPLTAPPMSRVTAIARTAQSSYELPFTIRMRLNGTLHATSQYGAIPLTAELDAEERTVEVRGFVRSFVAGELSFAPRQRPMTAAECASLPDPTLGMVRPGGGRSIVHLP